VFHSFFIEFLQPLNETSAFFLSFTVGAILAGFPFSCVAKYIEWKGSFILLEVLLIGVLVLKILTRNLEYKMVPTKKKLQ